ncbi:chemotaxis protein CheB [Mucilaginibacter paludis]|uniref:histidine kinase n=1 Tax=Mucilaginibacter paludis DSM 18603 TaxID=714943 RepID=H1Y749_9SPHI|nr:chemotaxis protein CheB [Mucilaginibacter paludis]EHQ28668.1 signal transduction histidine kinase with CheB and CheR activity [Mucilaginibacter paludis DSM 18603]
MAKVKPLQFPESKLADRYIIAIGASAGGLEAIHDFFDHMPGNSGFTFVVIQHLSPDYKSLLVDLVSKHTHMKVFEATNDVILQRDCVYIIPNKKIMTIRGNKLRLVDKIKDKSPNTAIDTFLFTLAKDKKDKAIAIILSGTGTDGTKGVEAIKECGGMVIVQDPATAKFDGMPNSAITSGNADFILPPAKMHVEVYNYVNQRHLPLLEQDQLDDNLLNEIFRLVHISSGQDFNLYKTPTILRRIARRMAAVEIDRLENYIGLLHQDPQEVKVLAKDFLIGVTKFFRDKPAFDILAQQIIPAIVKSKQEGEIIKIWVCACSTGEEAYSIAILFNDYLDRTGESRELKIFATDVDESSIEIAARNCYPLSIGNEVPAALLSKYFVKDDKNYSVLPGIRKQIVFARHNVIKSPPFIKNDLVTCRNMLIYMNNLLQQKIMSTFHYALNKEGYLFLGSSENAASIKEGVNEISGKWKIYQKTGTINYGLHHTYTTATPNLKYTEKRPLAKPGEYQKHMEEEFRELMISEFSAVGIFIDKSYIIKETIGNYSRYLNLPEKKLDLNILNMVNREVSVMLNTAIRKAWKERQKTHLNRVKLKHDDREQLLQITVKPPDESSTNDYTLLLFSEIKTDPVSKEGIVLPPVNAGSDQEYLMEMEAELSETRINLQMAVEEMETTNEELQSSNEELLSANEELQSGNEELQSLNEELHTLNTEHQLKIRELVELNDDLDNYFRSTDIGQIFVDANLRIRKFNPAAINMINLIDADVGRPINHLSNNILYDNLIADIHSVLATGQVIEKEVLLKSGTNNLMRIMPYVKKDGQHDGVVISFIDISVIVELNQIISGVFNASTAAILAFRDNRTEGSKNPDFRCIAYNDAALTLFGKPAVEMDAQPRLQSFPELIGIASAEQYAKAARQSKAWETELHTGQDNWYQVTIGPMREGFVVSLTNITARKNAEQKLKKNYHELINAREGLKNLNSQLENKVYERTQKLTESEERFKLVSTATNDTIWDWNLVSNTMWRSDNFTSMFGYQRDDETNQISFWFGKIHPDDRLRVEQSVFNAINHHEKQWSAEYRFQKADGTYAIILDRGRILEDEFHTPYRLVGSIIDITRLIETEKRLSQSENKFRKVFDSNLIGMCFADPDGRLLETNDAFLNMLGYSRADMETGQLNLQNLTPPTSRQASSRAQKELDENGFCQPYEKQYIRKDGSLVSVLKGSAMLSEDEKQISVSYILDITRQKELQHMISKQQEEFYSIFTNAPALITIRRGPNLVYEFVNNAFIRLDGQQNYIGRSTAEINQWWPGTELGRADAEVMRSGQPFTGRSVRIQWPNAQTGKQADHWFDFIFTPVFNDDDKLDGIAFFGFDVTELVKARETTEELMHKKDEFLSIASHELKTPITSLKGSLQILQRIMAREGGKNTVMDFVGKANNQTNKLTTLVDDLLDVTKIQAGKLLLNYETFDAVQLVKEVLEEVRAQEGTHEFILQGEGLITITADRTRLEQVITNFLTNAIKYSPKGDKVILNCSLFENEFKLTVQDFGIGIPEAKKDYLFDRFYRVQESSTHFSGLGLGLYISAEIIKRHRGQIGVESAIGEGATFWFTVPLQP